MELIILIKQDVLTMLAVWAFVAVLIVSTREFYKLGTLSGIRVGLLVSLLYIATNEIWASLERHLSFDNQDTTWMSLAWPATFTRSLGILGLVVLLFTYYRDRAGETSRRNANMT